MLKSQLLQMEEKRNFYSQHNSNSQISSWRTKNVDVFNIDLDVCLSTQASFSIHVGDSYKSSGTGGPLVDTIDVLKPNSTYPCGPHLLA